MEKIAAVEHLQSLTTQIPKARKQRNINKQSEVEQQLADISSAEDNLDIAPLSNIRAPDGSAVTR
jgi:hypothetical protein